MRKDEEWAEGRVRHGRGKETGVAEVMRELAVPGRWGREEEKKSYPNILCLKMP